MNVEKFIGPGSTPARRRFWDSVADQVTAQTKQAGKNVVVNEVYGERTTIDVDRKGGQQTQTGACCIDGECSITTRDVCNSSGGHYLGNGTTCEGIDCTKGACCHVDGSCTVTTAEECDGEYQGDGTVCEGTDCTHTGGCCHPDNSCSITTESHCDGVYQGDGTTCEGIDCTTTGACCVDGICSQTTEEDCEGTFQGIGTLCTPDPCTECTGCAFLNPADGRYYLKRTLNVTADYHHEGTGFTIDAHYETVKVDTCSGGEITCEGSGSGTFDFVPEVGDECHCTEEFFCGGPAFGFYGESGMTFSETCDIELCGSGFVLVCDFGDCTIISDTTYSIPCIPV